MKAGFRRFVLVVLSGFGFAIFGQSSKSTVNCQSHSQKSQQPTANNKSQSQQSKSKKNPTGLPIFLYLCAVVPPKSGAAVFIEKKASFRLSVSVNLDNSRMLVRISEIKLAYECLLPNTNRWGLFFSILLTGSPDPTEWRLSNKGSTFFLCGVVMNISIGQTNCHG